MWEGEGAVLVQQIETHHLLTLLYTMRQAHISNIVSRTHNVPLELGQQHRSSTVSGKCVMCFMYTAADLKNAT